AEITLLTTERHAGYSRCGLPFVLGGHIPRFTDLIVFPSTFYKMMKLNLLLETTATKVDTEAKTVEIQDKTGKQKKLPYDSLIIATGAFAFVPPIKGREKQGVYVVRTIGDGERIDKAIKAGAESAVVVGGGLIGLEVAIAFVERGLKTTVVELLPQILPAMLDADMARQVHEMLEQKGLRIIVGKGVDEILGTEKVAGVSVGGEQISADLVVVATGVRANVELAKNAGIATGDTRAIKVNARMETNLPGVYAIGDCTESINLVTGRPSLAQLGTVAVRQGKVAGINAAGGYSIFPGILGSAVTKFFETEIGVTGLTEFFAKRVGIRTVTGAISSKTKADYYPGALPIKVKLVVEKESQRIIGGQIIGGEEVTQRINALSFAIQKHMTVREFVKADTCYAPPLSETWEPMVLAAEIALRRLR
ncbi:FAD-dependent oxidoreductase, partial [Candidatus Bathyarchaeota archaeon]|nr:FAD-dependent oxidoreductase [Candidatus Bathyarchaeota archaeon]NIV44278.1 FAD-dependent oxidoreductase [Candidatus Bathyarchaeota archaeon]NIW10668.1 FAD-dependent oxidoreductase [Gammaproteobacteria bacterium]